MGRRHELVFALNAGGVDPEALSRVDLEKLRLAAEHPMANLLPRVLGPATLRPGTESLARIPSDAETHLVPFLRSLGTSYQLLMSPGEMRILLNGAIQQVPNVATAIASGSWSNVSSSPATATGGTSLTFTATATKAAKLRQTVTVASGDQLIQHILRVVVSRGPVFLRVGTTAGGQDVLSDVELDTGTHKIAFLPGAATVYVEIRADDPVTRTVSEVQFEATALSGAGDLVIPTPWDTIDKVHNLRSWQSIDTLFCGDGNNQQRRIEHHGPLSWGIALYKTDDGPFILGSSQVTLTPSAQTGNITITASDNAFVADHVGTLLELTQAGKIITTTFDGLAQTSDYITVVGTSSGRAFYITGVSTSFVGTIVLERSLDADTPVTWVTYATYTNSGVGFARAEVNDALNNLTAFYRFRSSAYTSGSAVMTLDYAGAVQSGRARITGYTDTTHVSAEVIKTFGNVTATRDWRIGDWSNARGWPRTPIIHDDRMHWFRDDTDYASRVSDYYYFDDTGEGDSEPFTRSVGLGGQSGVLWAIGLEKLLVGTEMFEARIAASELDEPLTPTKYTVRQPSRQGCLDLDAVVHDVGAFFVQRSGRRLYQITKPDQSTAYRSMEMSRLNPAAYRPGIDRHDVQQQPDTRHWAVVDGNLVVLTYDKDDKVCAITTVTIAGGTVEDVACLSESDQDDVYLIVNRSGARYVERIAKEADQRAVSTCALLDAHKVLTGSISAISGGTHLAGQTVAVWADGQRRDSVTLDGSGNASLGATYARVVYGLPYTASFKSVKLAYAAGLGTALGQTKQVHGAAVILSTSCLDGVTVSGDGVSYDPMPAIVNGAERTPSQFFQHYDADIFPLQSEWNTDARFWIAVDSSKGPCTIQAVVLDVETRDGGDAAAGNNG